MENKNSLIPFDYNGQQIRVVVIGGEPWFVAKDACEILDLGNIHMAIERLDDDEKGVSSIDTLGGPQQMAIISEPGLYSLTLGSKKPEAKPFKRFVTHKVLPSIRKTGSFIGSNSKRKNSLSSVNHAVEIMARRWEQAGVDPNYQVLALTGIYKSEGLNLPDPPITVDEPAYDLTGIGKELGIMSQASGGKVPHADAVGAIVATLNVPDDLIIRAPYTNNGHSDSYFKYKAPVLEQVREWLEEHDYPSVIHGSKNYKVAYQKAGVPAC